ncbi:CAAX farnesyltransferase (FTase) subunit beta [Thelotrema lepadinum]|nr:CAAX farnesyltransferase (FTase) subunit beta [Thelotrema lepadinum]
MAQTIQDEVQRPLRRPHEQGEEEEDAEVTELAQRLVQNSLPIVPSLFTSQPFLQDSLQTETSINQENTIKECLPYLTKAERNDAEIGTSGLPRLKRQLHINFLLRSLEEKPSVYVGFDSSRSWIVYWALAGLCLLGEDVTSHRERVIQTFTAAQNVTGGFGSGHGQVSHIAPSYAVVLSLAMVGGSDALEIIDRKAMWEWLGEIKQPEGGFSVTVGGEVDVRGAYCAIVVISLLNLPLELPPRSPARRLGLSTFLDNLPEWLAKCQTYEGGMAAFPGNEAHGAYAFCVLACLCMLGEPSQMIQK